MGLTDSPICQKYLDKHIIAKHVLCKWEAVAYLRFRHLGDYFMEQDDYHETPISRILNFILSVELSKG
jgi:hypothetical protein